MSHAVHKSDDGTIEITISLPWSEISQTYNTVVDQSVANAELSGFRKGKAPRQMVIDSLDKNKVYEETIKRLIPKAYTNAIEEHKLAPIMMPQIELKESKEGSDWVVIARTCERPKVTLGEYKKAVNALKAEKTQKIIVPGKDEESQKPQKPSMEEILTAISSAITVTIPEILLEHEVNHQLSQLVDQTKKLGLTVDQYLSSTGKTAESIREEYTKQAKLNVSLEFGLEAIAEQEGVVVSDEEVNKVISGAKTEEEKKSLESQRYYVTSLIRRQKTLDVLTA